MHRTNRLQQLLRRSVLQQETTRTGTHRRIHVLINIEGGEHNNAHPLIRLTITSPTITFRTLSVTLQDAARRLQAVAVRHAHIHEDDLRRLPLRDHTVKNVNSRQSVISFHDDLQVRLGVDEHAQAAAHQALVVDEHHTDRLGVLRCGRVHGFNPRSQWGYKRSEQGIEVLEVAVGERRLNEPAAVRLQTVGEGAVVEGDALAHAAQTVTATGYRAAGALIRG